MRCLRFDHGTCYMLHVVCDVAVLCCMICVVLSAACYVLCCMQHARRQWNTYVDSGNPVNRSERPQILTILIL